jgi:ATP-dependent exoDNAse (exonuclease V) beta subunit
MGLRQHRLLEADESGQVSQEGIRAYEEWRARRESMLGRGRRPLRRLETATELARSAMREEIAIPEAAEIALERLDREPTRPSGPRFGALVHAILMSVGPHGREDSISRCAAMHARILGASFEETSAAIQLVTRTLKSPLMSRAALAAQVRRESPVVIRLADGLLIEGVADLAFEEAQGWTVVDFKTDTEIAGRLDEYRAQLGLYVRGIRASTSRPASGVLLWL